MSKEFIPTLGNLIKKTDDVLSDVPKSCYPVYAKLFEGTMIETIIFYGESFEEQACEYCREAGWRSPT
uniref:Uncharacterized protein n=1 Tax=viral metagenome TaxID=1070528 RepID=A0A6M3XU00_9ZZZZ